MKIPEEIIKNDKEYKFISQINDNLFLYQDKKIGVKETFTKYDLNLIDNSKIDAKLEIRYQPHTRVLVYDKMFDKETIYNSISEASREIKISEAYVSNCLNHKKWMKKRYFIERIDE